MALHHSFEGSRVLVTGSGTGIGRGIVQKLYDDKAHVFVIDKNPILCEKLKKDFPNVTVACVDISDWKATKEAVERFGVLDHVVNNAAIILIEPFLDVTEETFLRQFGVNIKGMIPIVQAAANGMIKSGKGGSIVNISSTTQLACTGFSVYSSNKAGVNKMTKAMALELGKYNIRVNSISPGAVDTEMLENLAKIPNQEHKHSPEAMIERSIFPSPMTPDKIVDAVLFLLSPGAEMITGTDLIVDGGIAVT